MAPKIWTFKQICCFSIMVSMVTRVIWSEPTSGKMSLDSVIEYFTHYQYMGMNNPDPRIASLTDPKEALKQACLTFQRNWGLEVTGELTDEMLELMSAPRCSVADINIMEETKRRKKRYISFSKWNHNNITYKITRFPQDWDLTQAEVVTTVEKAFKVWSDVSSLTFTRRSHYDPVDINIQFGSYSHGDYYPFDGPNGYLAHAFFPPVGDTHFDDSETWTLTANHYNFFAVAVHEFGHALGLGHNTYVRSAIMFPNYHYSENFHLDYDDIRGIQSLYGPPITRRTQAPPQPNPPTHPPPTKTPDKPDKPTVKPATQDPKVTYKPTQPDYRPKGSPVDLSKVCENPRIDAMMYVDEPRNPAVKGTYGFHGPYYFKINDMGFIPAGYPRLIADDWPGIPDNIDAALYWSDDPPKNFIFKGNDYWAVEGMRIKPGYPKKISDMWGGLPSDITAAFVWNKNGKTYFIKGDKYYRYTRGRGLDYGYPREVERNWVGIPSGVDAAFQWDNMHTYFFKGNLYWRFQDNLMMVADHYPRKISRTWFKCQRQDQDGHIYADDDEDSFGPEGDSEIQLAPGINPKSGEKWTDSDENHGDQLTIHYWTIVTAISLTLAHLTFH